jgi:H+/Cl- antiporter ClcA
VSLSSFRGGPTFPALFLGAVGGVALSHLPGLPLVDGVAMGIGAMSAVMLRLPLTSVLLATLLLASDGLAIMPLVIVTVVVAYVVSAKLAPSPVRGSAPGRQDRAHEPQDRDEEADQAQDPVTLEEGDGGHREQQDEIQDAEAEEQS